MNYRLILLSLFAFIVANVSGQLLTGTLVRQGAIKETVLGNAEGVEEVKGKEVAKGQEENVAPSNELLMGEALGDFDKKPSAAEVEVEIRNEGGDPDAGYKETKGSVLDDDVKSGKYISNPAQVLGEVLSSGKEMPEEVEGEILAGDAVELNVLTMEKWYFFLDSMLNEQYLCL